MTPQPDPAPDPQAIAREIAENCKPFNTGWVAKLASDIATALAAAEARHQTRIETLERQLAAVDAAVGFPDGDGHGRIECIERLGSTAEREHELKVWPQFFDALASGAKTFELRKNDRGFQVGDTLRLREWDLATREYSGREVFRRITYVLADSSLFDVLQDGYAILGIVAPALTRGRAAQEEAQLDRPKPIVAMSIDRLGPVEFKHLALDNEAHERAVREWAADDRLWTTQETVEFNLRTFVRTILAPAQNEAWQRGYSASEETYGLLRKRAEAYEHEALAHAKQLLTAESRGRAAGLREAIAEVELYIPDGLLAKLRALAAEADHHCPPPPPQGREYCQGCGMSRALCVEYRLHHARPCCTDCQHRPAAHQPAHDTPEPR